MSRANLALKRAVVALGQKPGVGRDRVAQRLDPSGVRLGEITKHVIMHQRFVAWVTDADPHAAVVVAKMARSRTLGHYGRRCRRRS